MNEEERLLIGNLLCADTEDETHREGHKGAAGGRSVAPAPGPVHVPTSGASHVYWPEPPPPYSPPSGPLPPHQSWLPPPPPAAGAVDLSQPPPPLPHSGSLCHVSVEQLQQHGSGGSRNGGGMWQRPLGLPQVPAAVPDEPFVSAPSTPTQAHRAAVPPSMGAHLSALVQSLPVARVHHHHIHHVQHMNPATMPHQRGNYSTSNQLKQNTTSTTTDSVTSDGKSGMMQYFAVDSPPPNLQQMLMDLSKAPSGMHITKSTQASGTSVADGFEASQRCQGANANSSSDSPPPNDPVVLPRTGLSYRDALYRDEARENRTSSTTSATSVDDRQMRPSNNNTAVSGALPKRAPSPPPSTRAVASGGDSKWNKTSARRSSGSVGAERRCSAAAIPATVAAGRKPSKAVLGTKPTAPKTEAAVSAKRSGKSSRGGRSVTRTAHGQAADQTTIAAGRFEVLANEDVFSSKNDRADKDAREKGRGDIGGASADGLKAMATNQNGKGADGSSKTDPNGGRSAIWVLFCSIFGWARSDSRQSRRAANRGPGGGNAAGNTLGSRKHAQGQENVVVVVVRQIGLAVWYYVSMALKWLYLLVYDIASSLYEIMAHVAVEWAGGVWLATLAARRHLQHYLGRLAAAGKHALMSVIRWRPPWQRGDSPSDQWAGRMGADGDFALQENIELPATGEAAMRRLLAARGQDAYTILGVRADCSDDTLKRYYKRQAVLVHPDKNDCAGADEAFKILCAAFEMVNTTDKRAKYNMENFKSKAMEELDLLMAALAAKLDAALCAMPCECGRTHRRYVIQRPVAEARYCNRCGCRHPARPNDLWAETRFFGFLWYYYACMDGRVYDITEWAGCDDNHLKHMKPNAHTVQYRLVGAARRHNQPTGAGPAAQGRQFSQSQVETLLANAAAAAAAATQSPSSRHSPSPSGSDAPLGTHAPAHQASYQPPARGTGRRRRK